MKKMVFAAMSLVVCLITLAAPAAKLMTGTVFDITNMMDSDFTVRSLPGQSVTIKANVNSAKVTDSTNQNFDIVDTANYGAHQCVVTFGNTMPTVTAQSSPGVSKLKCLLEILDNATYRIVILPAYF